MSNSNQDHAARQQAMANIFYANDPFRFTCIEINSLGREFIQHLVYNLASIQGEMVLSELKWNMEPPEDLPSENPYYIEFYNESFDELLNTAKYSVFERIRKVIRSTDNYKNLLSYIDQVANSQAKIAGMLTSGKLVARLDRDHKGVFMIQDGGRSFECPHSRLKGLVLQDEYVVGELMNGLVNETVALFEQLALAFKGLDDKICLGQRLETAIRSSVIFTNIGYDDYVDSRLEAVIPPDKLLRKPTKAKAPKVRTPVSLLHVIEKECASTGRLSGRDMNACLKYCTGLVAQIHTFAAGNGIPSLYLVSLPNKDNRPYDMDDLVAIFNSAVSHQSSALSKSQHTMDSVENEVKFITDKFAEYYEKSSSSPTKRFFLNTLLLEACLEYLSTFKKK